MATKVRLSDGTAYTITGTYPAVQKQFTKAAKRGTFVDAINSKGQHRSINPHQITSIEEIDATDTT